MNKKIVCRIVINSYISFGTENVLSSEVKLLRAGKDTRIDMLNRLMNIHNKIILGDINVNFDYLITFIKNNFDVDLKENYNSYIKILRAYTRGKYNEIINEIMQTYDNSIYKIVIAELITNLVLFKNEKRMLLFRFKTLEELANRDNQNTDYIKVLEKETYPYLLIKKVLSKTEIREIISYVKSSLNNYIEIYNIKIFGSYALGTEDKNSDLDIYAETNDNVIPFVLLNIKDGVFKKYNIFVDIIMHKSGTDYDDFERDLMKYAIDFDNFNIDK